MAAAQELSLTVGVTAACAAMGVSRATEFRQRNPQVSPEKTAHEHPRALNMQQRQDVLDTLSSERFVDWSPAAVYATVLDERIYKCSTSTMYRILQANKAVRERRAHRRHTPYTAPQLLATRPNEVWSWDITKLLGVGKFQNFQLYAMLDIYSRMIVGWLVAERESGLLAEVLIEECCRRQNVEPGTLSIHSDNGPAMVSKTVVELHSRLNLHKGVSRPYTSNDNPYSEAHFRTLKYRPMFPKRFSCIEDVRVFLTQFFEWYNSQHCHRGIAYMTPEMVHYGRAAAVTQQRAETLALAYAAAPQRFSRGMPKPFELPQAVWINGPPQAQEADFLKEKLSGSSVEVKHPEF